MRSAYLLASDVGSGACKTLVTDLRGHVVAEAQKDYPTSYPQPGWAEQNPDDWYAAFCQTVRTVLDKGHIAPAQIAGIGIAGVTHNTVLLDDRDRPLCPSILMFDNRSVEQVQSILARWGTRVWEQTLNDVTPTWSWPQLLWIRQNWPAVWQATRCILFPKDYVRHRLAPSPVTDVIDAAGTLLFDPMKGVWITDFCQDLGLRPEQLPSVVEPLAVVGQVCAQGAADTGLVAGTPVIAGTTDTAAEVLGSGAVCAGDAIVKLASVGRIAVVADAPLRQPHTFNYRHVLDGLWYPGTASKYAASAYRWLRAVLWRDLADSDAYRRMDQAAAEVSPGAGGLLFHPHLMGEWAPYWDEQMRGDFVGLTIRHTRAHLTRAVLEGVAFALRDALDEMQGLGLRAANIRLIGQGAKSALWAQIVSNVLDRPLLMPAQHDAVYGAALITAMAVGAIERTAAAITTLLPVPRQVTPAPATAARYHELFQLYRESDAALRSISARLHQFEAREPSHKERVL